MKHFHHALAAARRNPGERDFSLGAAEAARAFHQTLPGYEPTPLVRLSSLALLCGLEDIFVKDESKRFGLNAFKVLGGSWCIANIVAKKLGLEKPDFRVITDPETLAKLPAQTFITATDGNHGMGIAWTARALRQRCVVYLPKGSSEARVERIRRTGAKAEVLDLNYDDTVEYARREAEANGWNFVQDTDRPDYEEIPTLIMQGYLTMALEAVEAMEALQTRPTHVFLQAGVGSMAGAVAAFLANAYRSDPPKFIVVEADAADCIYRTAEAHDGKLRTVDGDMRTIMAGLACGIPSIKGCGILTSLAEDFLSVPDETAALGMRVLGNPLAGDAAVTSGESGAATSGALYEICTRSNLADVRRALALDDKSVVLCFSTEGDTDADNYRRVVWDGVPSTVEKADREATAAS